MIVTSHMRLWKSDYYNYAIGIARTIYFVSYHFGLNSWFKFFRYTNSDLTMYETT